MVFEVITMKMVGRVSFGEKTRILFRQWKGRIMGVATGGRKPTKSLLSWLCLLRGAGGVKARSERDILFKKSIERLLTVLMSSFSLNTKYNCTSNHS